MASKKAVPKNMQQQFAEYAEKCVPLSASKGQLMEVKTAFYAGAFVMVKSFEWCSLESVPEDQAVAYVEALKAETEQYFNKLNQGETCPH